jgi:hypothetical protein
MDDIFSWKEYILIPTFRDLHEWGLWIWNSQLSSTPLAWKLQWPL